MTYEFNPDWMCTCGDLTTLGVVHRKDGPCYIPDNREGVGLTDKQESILNFLLGASDFDGVWYGERHPQKKGAFWWRDELRKAFQESAHGINAPLKEKST